MDRIPVHSGLKGMMRTSVSAFSRLVRVAIALMSLAACAMLPAQTLYVATGAWGANGALYTVNPATAASTLVGNITVTVSNVTYNVSIAGLAFHPTNNVLYGVTEVHSPNFPNWLVTIDPATGAATLVGATGLGTTITDISFSATGALYGWAVVISNNTVVDSDMATIDLTSGVATVIPTNYSGGTDIDSGGLGFDIGGVLYLSPQSSSEPLWIVNYNANPVTVSAGPSLNVGSPFNYINALAYSTANSTLYGVNAYTLFLPTKCDLFTIDPVTGFCTQIVGNHLPDNTHALAFSTTFASWKKLKFTTAEQASSAISGTTAVYGQDGIPNLVKYALGLEPKTNITTGLPGVSVSGSEWVFTYTRPTRMGDVTYSVEVSTDLVNWATTGVTHERVSTSASFIDTWRGRYPLASATNAFFRLNTKLTSAITVTVSSTDYTGSPIGGTASVSTADFSQSLTVTYTGISGTTYGPLTTAPTNAGTYSASASYAGDANHASSSASQGYTISKANTTTTVTVSDAVYDGSAHGGTASVTGPNLSQSLTITYTGINGTIYAATSTAPTNVGSYSATASYVADSNHNNSSDTKSFAITKAASTTTVTVSSAVYDGSPHGGTAVVTGPSLNQSLTVTYFGRAGTSYSSSTTPPTNAGNYTALANYAGDANHTSSSNSVDYTITQASSTTTVTTGDFSYDGNPHGQSATVTGANLNQSVTVSYSGRNSTTYGPSTTAPNSGGDYTASAIYAGDTNHTGSSDAKDYTINKAGSTTTVTVSNTTYDGSTHGGTALATGINLSQSVTISYSGRNGTIYGPSTTAPTDAGDYTASASFAGDASHTGSSDSKDYTISQASSTTTVTVTNATFDGNPHGGTAAVTGTNLSQSLTITYTGINGITYSSTTPPTDIGDYSASATFGGDTNHTGSSDSKNFSITP